MLVRLFTALCLLAFVSCAQVLSVVDEGAQPLSSSVCWADAVLAASVLAEKGYEVEITVQMTDRSKQGVYHAQARVKINGEWRWVVLDRSPKVYLGPREHGDVVETKTVSQAIEDWVIPKLQK